MLVANATFHYRMAIRSALKARINTTLTTLHDAVKLIFTQPRCQGLSSLPPLVVGTETLVAAAHVTTQNLGGRKICWKGGATGFSSRPNVLDYPPTLRFWMDRWSRDQPQPGSLFQRLREAEKRDPGDEVDLYTFNSVRYIGPHSILVRHYSNI